MITEQKKNQKKLSETLKLHAVKRAEPMLQQLPL